MQSESNNANALIAKWQHHAIEDVLERAVFVADNASSDLLLDIVETCLSLIPKYHPVRVATLRSFAALFKRLGLMNPLILPLLLQYLESLPDPLPFVDILPSLIAPNTPIVTTAFSTLRALLFTDPSFTLPMLNVIIDLPLSAQQKHDVTIVMEDALSSVEECDVPFLVRALLKSMMFAPNAFTVKRIRYELAHISLGILAVALESLWELIPLSTRLSQAFSQDILLNPPNSSTTPISDVALVLVLFRCQHSIKSKAVSVCESWLRAKAFPFEALVTFISMRQRNEVWSRILSEVWNLCLWLMDECSQLNWHEQPPHCWNSVHALVLSLYSNSIELRDNIMKSLLQRTRKHISPIARHMFLPSVQETFGVKDYTHISRDVLSLRKQANYSGDSVSQLVHVEPAAGSVVLEYLMQKLNATTKDTIELPPHPALHSTSGHMRAMENTLIIVIQKLLCAPVYAHHNRNQRIVNASKTSVECDYHISSLGVMLAAHLIARSSPLVVTDLSVLVSSIVNAITPQRHLNVVNILDALCVAHHHVSRRMDIDRANQESFHQLYLRALTKFLNAYRFYCWRDNTNEAEDRVTVITRKYGNSCVGSQEETITWNVQRLAEEAVSQQNASSRDVENIFWTVQRASAFHRMLLDSEKKSVTLRILCSAAKSSVIEETGDGELCYDSCELNCFMSDEAFKLKHKKDALNWQETLTKALELALVAALHQSYCPSDSASMTTVLRYIAASRYYLRHTEFGIRSAYGNKASSQGKRSSGDEEGTSDGKRGGSASESAENMHRRETLMMFVSEIRSDLDCLVLLFSQDILLQQVSRYSAREGLSEMLSFNGANTLSALNQHVLASMHVVTISDMNLSFVPMCLVNTDIPSAITCSSATTQSQDKNDCLIESISHLFGLIPELLVITSLARDCNDVAISQILGASIDVDYETARYCLIQILILASHALMYSTSADKVLEHLCDSLKLRYKSTTTPHLSWLESMIMCSNKFTVVLLLEHCIQTALDSAITLICVNMLLIISKMHDECFHERIAVIAWQAMHQVHGLPNCTLFPLRCSTTDGPSVSCAIMLQLSSIKQGSHTGFQRCEPLFREALMIQSRSYSGKTPFQLIECEAYDSFRLLCDVWWTHADAVCVTNGLIVMILESWSIASLGNFVAGSNSNDLRRSGRKRSKVTKENNAVIQTPTVQLGKDHSLMNRIDEGNACKYLLFSLSLLPALMQMLQPSSLYIDSDANGVGPFYSLKLCIQVMVCIVSDVERIQHMPHGSQLLVELTPKLLKIIRSYLFGLQYALNNAVSWRNDHEDENCSLSHLFCLLQHALAVTTTTSSFISTITQLMLYRGSHGLPSSLHISLPQLQLHIEKARNCIGQISAAHDMDLTGVVDMEATWSLSQHASSVEYLIKYSNDIMRCADDVTSHGRVVEVPVRRKRIEDDEAEEFIVESGSNGWGLYDNNQGTLDEDSDSLFDDDMNSFSFIDSKLFDDGDDDI